ncbi:MAG: hypothetical protein LBD01_00380 [Puniceicoccales bacterium]|jgi:hypothetical protein|nr:hypothetical protein [Puniceicoccales bacterium]
MKKIFALLSLLLASLPLRAQVAVPQPGTSASPIEVGADYTNLQGITHFYLDVSTTEGNSLLDAEFRNELRDLLELEFRRANMSLRTASQVERNPDTLPLLHLSIRYNPNIMRTSCELDLKVYDKASINRNKVLITAEIFKQTTIISIGSERTLQQNVKYRSRQIVADLIKGIKK